MQILRSAPVLIILSMVFICIQFITPTVFTFSFDRAFNAKEPFTLSFVVVYSLTGLLLLPLLINRFIFKEPLQNFGLQLPTQWKKAVLLIAIGLLLLAPVSIFFAHQPSIQVFYSLKNLSWANLAFIFFLALPPYYWAEEFFFRGFLFLRLWQKQGWHSYWITEVIFTFAHLGKPPLEILFAFPAGLVLNYLTLHTKSIYPAMVVHFTLGILVVVMTTFFVS